MSEFQPLIDQLYRQQVMQARALGPEGRVRLGFEMIEETLQKAKSLGEDEMQWRFAIERRIKEHGCYGPPVPRL